MINVNHSNNCSVKGRESRSDRLAVARAHNHPMCAPFIEEAFTGPALVMNGMPSYTAIKSLEVVIFCKATKHMTMHSMQNPCNPHENLRYPGGTPASSGNATLRSSSEKPDNQTINTGAYHYTNFNLCDKSVCEKDRRCRKRGMRAT